MPPEPAARRVTIAAVFAIAGAVVAVAIAVLSTEQNRVLLSTNGADEAEFVATGRRYCQRGEVIPSGTGAVRLLIGTYGRPGPGLRLNFRSPGRSGRSIATATLLPGWQQGHVEIPVTRVKATSPVTMCLQVRDGGPVALAGQRTLDRRKRLVRIEYLDAEKTSDLARLGTIGDHYGRGKSRWEGSWTLALTAILIVAALLLAARRMLVEGSRES